MLLVLIFYSPLKCLAEPILLKLLLTPAATKFQNKRIKNFSKKVFNRGHT